ncbi:carbohydrate ABC transporter membrane protein 2 (CUT1 family) [Anaerobacterium chartisolvens]|uniref:Carbohydrate ABC transporter membrane protein 2 (CUT1 family) n=1 Tax=Anaerobacterium chartisolvens TaxID=1297424 RepID=A0A369ALK0_9FIRM|nr:carbohydrate ABC transporter permease [Anaerobacterium chartisolvens]RCX09965.1 carbohydrate ABC transporter membrane protein 2 (CUT1 family) [Anaerobacterium chartisolvens]
MKKTRAEKAGMIINGLLLLLITFITIYPFWHVLMYSISNSQAASSGGLFFIPRELDLLGYRMVLKQPQLYIAYWNTIARTGVGTLISVILTAMLAYPLSLPRLRGRRFLCIAIFFTMLFNGGMIPTYILINDLHMIDTFWALVLPNAMTAYNLFIMRNYFQSIPASLEESARIDGANPITILFRIVIPISTPTLAAVGMFYGVTNWNAYLDGVLYINSNSLQILQVYLRNLFSSAGSGAVLSGVQGISETSKVTEETLKMVTISISVIPILVIYPYIQKYYTTGITTGAVKG